MAGSRLQRLVRRARFGAAQGARVAWYGAHAYAMRRAVRRIEGSIEDPRRRIKAPQKPIPDQQRLFADVARLLARDLANVERGHYPLPQDESGGLAGLLRRSRLFFDDLPEVTRRRLTGAAQEVTEEGGARPRYYLQNFHYQTDGWMSERSAELYDIQVEVLFLGAAAAMRRQALVPIAELAAGRDQRTIAYADIACGNGGFAAAVKQACPRLPVLGLDLSEAYCGIARARTRDRGRVGFGVADAARLPLASDSLDLATAIYLFHELPPKIRPKVAGEIARVLRPGGRLVFLDSLQTGDEPDYDGLLELFPALFHEPYFGSYLGVDLVGLFARHGLEVEQRSTAFLSKLLVLRKRPAPGAEAAPLRSR